MEKCKDKWSHSFVGDKCEWCGISQLELSGKKLKKVKPKIVRKNITSEFQLMVDDLITYLKVPVKEFPRFARYVKQLGFKNVPKIISEMKQLEEWVGKERSGRLNRVGYFINKFIKKNEYKRNGKLPK